MSGYLVGSAAFKAVGTSDPRPAGSIPVHLRHISEVHPFGRVGTFIAVRPIGAAATCAVRRVSPTTVEVTVMKKLFAAATGLALVGSLIVGASPAKAATQPPPSSAQVVTMCAWGWNVGAKNPARQVFQVRVDDTWVLVEDKPFMNLTPSGNINERKLLSWTNSTSGSEFLTDEYGISGFPLTVATAAANLLAVTEAFYPAANFYAGSPPLPPWVGTNSRSILSYRISRLCWDIRGDYGYALSHP